MSPAGAGRLVVCPTPIGNLDDITARVVEALRGADVIACEDTRTTGVLCDRHGIDTPRVRCDEHGERRAVPRLLERIAAGDTVALVSDAGTPVVSDPGFLLVRGAIEAGLPVEVLPGPSSVTTALVLSGLPADSWRFCGFLPRRRSDLEEALVHQLEDFLLELGGDFTFIGRQKRLRIGDEWYRVDLVFYHRRLRCLVIIDLKIGKLTHADIGQIHLYLNYARAHWTHPDENPPVGLILCASKDATLAKYALEGLNNKVLAAEYKMVLPDERVLVAELEKSRKKFERKKR